ncbi:MAG: hypothetical protein NT026_01230 [Candidatus Staskawiczbacteria bacterium]|nr:hypothetical protein [Candidatus Staskawiczbacteria bacterium]
MPSDLFATGNIVFFAVYAAIVLIILVVLFIIIRVFIKLFSALLGGLFPKKKVIHNDFGENIEPVVKELAESQAERAGVEGQKTATREPKLGFTDFSVQSEKKEPGQKDKPKPEEVGYQKGRPNSPEAGLGALKSKGVPEEQILESKMPSRGPAEEAGQIDNKGVDIQGALKKSDNHEKIKIPVAEKNEGIHGEAKEPGEVNSDSEHGLDKILAKTANNSDTSIFGGKSEVSRISLRQKLRRDPKVWKAERAVGLTLSPIERAKLEKEVFAPVYGRNISKTDLKWGIKKLNKKMLGTKNASAHEKLRKEIKFFKKIGGVK